MLKIIKKLFNEDDLIDFKTNTYNELFKEKTIYKVKDGIFSLILIVLMFFGYGFLAGLFRTINISTEIKMVLNTVFDIIIIGIVYIYMKINKQTIKSIGFNRKTLFPSFRYGLLWTMVLIIILIMIKILSNSLYFNKSFKDIIINIFYYLFTVSLFEEIVFRGFLNDRLRGLFKNIVVTSIICAVCFSLLHIPFRIVYENTNNQIFFKEHILELTILFFMHFFFQYFYYRYKNIVSPTILHFFWDFGQWILG